MILQNLEFSFIEPFLFGAFGTEIFLTTAIMLLLVWILIFQNRKGLGYLTMSSSTVWIATLILLLALYITAKSSFVSYHWYPLNGTLALDPFSYTIRIIILGLGILFFCVSSHYMKNSFSGVNEFCCLILLAILSLVVLVSVNDFICLFLCIELQGLSFYVLACFRKNSDYSIEAGIKYFITGAIASCFMLFGISLIYGISGSINFLELKQLFSSFGQPSISEAFSGAHTPFVGLNLGLAFLFSALLFKLGAAPFHFWVADVYEGAPSNVTAFFVLVPKIALIAIIIRLLFDVFEPVSYIWQPILLQCATLSVIIGTFGAIYQRRIKRLLAYSTIGHNGFLILALTSPYQQSVEAMIVYVVVYVLTSACIFVFVLNVRERGCLNENPTFYEACGVIKTNPLIGLSLSLPLFSLAGIPPLVGFVAKYQIFAAAIQQGFIIIPTVLIITSVIGCFYYIRLTKVNFFEHGHFVWNDSLNRTSSILLGFCCVSLFLLTFLPNFFIIFS
jgi:NADH-quinone oxidoreductase subunit N